MHSVGMSEVFNNEDAHLLRLKEEYLRQITDEQLRAYEPNPKQLEFHKDNTNIIRALFGGNQSGKTYAGCVEVAWTVGKVHPYRPNWAGRVTGRDCAEDYKHHKDVTIPTYEKMLPRYACKLDGLTYEGKPRIWPGLLGESWREAYKPGDDIIYLKDGSFIEFKSYESGYEKMQGPARHIIRLDEEPKSKKIYDENLARFATTKTNLILTLTPLAYTRWLITDLMDEGNRPGSGVGLYKMPVEMNPFVSPGYIESLKKNIKNKAELNARLTGEPTFVQGRVYGGYYGDHNLYDPFPIPDRWSCSFVIDPHPDKPTAVGWFAENPATGNIYMYREAEITGTTEMICKEIKNLSAGEYIDLMIIDKKGSENKNKQDGRNNSLFAEYRKHLPGLIQSNSNKDLRISVTKEAVADRINGPYVRVSKECPKADRQMRNYSFKPPTSTGEERSRAETVRMEDEFPDIIGYRVLYSGAGRRGRNKTSRLNMGMYANG